MSAPVVPKPDLKALIEACVMDGYAFGSITKEVRNEWKYVGVRDAITMTAGVMQELSSETGALGATAKRVWMDWRNAHPNLTL